MSTREDNEQKEPLTLSFAFFLERSGFSHPLTDYIYRRCFNLIFVFEAQQLKISLLMSSE